MGLTIPNPDLGISFKFYFPWRKTRRDKGLSRGRHKREKDLYNRRIESPARQEGFRQV